MKRFIAAFTAFALSASIVTAAQISDKPPSGPTETIQVRKAMDLRNALDHLTGTHDEIIGQGSNQRTVQIPYAFDDDTTWAMVDDIQILQKFLDTAEKVRKSIVAEAESKNGGPLTPDNADAQKALNDRVQELLDSEREIPKLFRIKKSALKPRENHVPGNLIPPLAPILE
jgi:hypothetical protein